MGTFALENIVPEKRLRRLSRCLTVRQSIDSGSKKNGKENGKSKKRERELRTENRNKNERPEKRINEIQMEVNLMPSINQSLGPCKEIKIVVPRHLSIVS